jgi:fermentation-respiration switch protein FrsA (DUF1100 family)
MVWRILHELIVCFYIVAPVGAIVLDALRARKTQRTSPGAWLVGVVLAGVIVGTSITVLYSVAVGGRVRVGQAMLGSYFAIGMLLLLRGFDYLIQRGIGAALRLPHEVEKPTVGLRLRALFGSLVRFVVLFAIGLPYVMATVLTYRPKVDMRDDPQKQLGFAFQPVEFTATDGTKLSGWWLPAEHPNRRGDTVLICHGLASNKSNQLILSRGFVPYGYNVLIFDFRAHGQSGGQLTSFGDLERRDVLGAIHWLRENHQSQSRHIYGVGASMGAAALIAAAADPSPEGKAIDAIAAYGTYDSIREELRFIAADRFVAPLRWVVEQFGLGMASAQVGADLRNFSPVTLVQELWPRPIMVIHGVNDEIISFDRGRALFNSAQQPKARIWIDRAGHNDIINDDNVARRVREFFHDAQPVPVI